MKLCFGCSSWISSGAPNTGSAVIFGTFSCLWYTFPPIMFYLPALIWGFLGSYIAYFILCSVDISGRPAFSEGKQSGSGSEREGSLGD